MKPNLLKTSSTETVVLEKETKEKPQNEKMLGQEKNILTSTEKKQNLKKQPAETPKTDLKQQHLENKKSLFNAFSANLEEKQEKQAFIKQESLKKQKFEEETQQIQEEVIESSLVSFKAKAKPKKKTSGFRFKLIGVVYAVVLGISLGWVGANAIRLAETQSLIHAQDVKYVQKLAELDKLKDNENNNAELIPWEQLLPVQSLPLEDVTEYQVESNWFDNIINWFGKLFGG